MVKYRLIYADMSCLGCIDIYSQIVFFLYSLSGNQALSLNYLGK